MRFLEGGEQKEGGVGGFAKALAAGNAGVTSNRKKINKVVRGCFGGSDSDEGRMNNLLPEVQADNPFGTYVEEEEADQHQHQHHHVALDLVEEKGDHEEAMENIVRKEESAAPSKAKARWKSSVELVSSGRKKEWVPDSDMVDFFSTITKIDDLVKEMESGVHKLEATHLRSKVATTPAVVRSLRDEMAEEITRCALRSKDALNLFKQIEGARKGKLSALSQQKLRMRQTILDAKRRQFKKTMAKFSQLRLEVQADYKVGEDKVTTSSPPPPKMNKKNTAS